MTIIWSAEFMVSYQHYPVGRLPIIMHGWISGACRGRPIRGNVTAACRGKCWCRQLQQMVQ